MALIQKWLRALPFAGVGLLCALAAWPPAVTAQTQRLRLVSTPWSPFTNEAGQPRFATDLVDEALRRAGISTETVIVPPADFAAALLGGTFDGSAAVWKDAERERVLHFSEPYLENRLVLLGRRGSNVSPSPVIALAGKRVAVIEGYSYGAVTERIDGPVFVRSESEEQSLRMVLSGDVDYMLIDDLVVQYLLEHHAENARERLAIGSEPLITRSLHFAVRRDRPGAADIVSGFNAQLPQMVADRSYHRLLHLDWIRADVTGDGVAELVPRSDRIGTSPPQRGYELFSSPTPDAGGSQRFFVGGNTYVSWASVPDRYKIVDADRPDPRRSTVPLFRFVW